MGASGAAARTLQGSFDKIPAEIHAEILKYLPPTQLLRMIQIVPSIRCGIRSWDFIYFTAQQLVYLHRFISGVMEIGAEKNGQPRIEIPEIDKVRNNIVNSFPKVFPKYKDVIRLSLEPDNFDCHYIYYMLTTSESAKPQQLCMEEFLEGFYYKNQIVRSFCHIVANLDRHGTCNRPPRNAPNKNALISHLLFWLATDYVWEQLKQSKQVNRDIAASYWDEFTFRVDEIFGQNSPTSQSFRNCVIQPGSFLVRYRDHISVCDRSNLNLIFDAVCPRGYHDFSVYPTYMLSLGLDRALSFLNQDPKEIEVVRRRELREICAWKGIWTNFKELEVGYSSAPVH